jgi:IS30 family transposase
MRPRIRYTENQKALMWERWQKGESLQQIAQLFDRNHSSIYKVFWRRPAGSVRPHAAIPMGADPGRTGRDFAHGGGGSFNACDAAQLGRAPSTISREIKRNGGQACYRASQADQSAWDRGRRPKTGKLAANRALARLVAGKLQRQWSPEQVAG